MRGLLSVTGRRLIKALVFTAKLFTALRGLLVTVVVVVLLSACDTAQIDAAE
jgi:hypothetical protein